MKRLGIHKPTIEDAVEISGIEILHPGGFRLTRRTAEIAGLKNGMKVLDVSSGRGTNALFYAKEFGANVTGIDISDEMIETSRRKAKEFGYESKLKFIQGDSQKLPFEDGVFDVVINECAVGIPDDSQKVLNEMSRVTKLGGVIVIHESTWKKSIPDIEKTELAERYGTTPLEHSEWVSMLKSSGIRDIISEFEEWSSPEMFWNVRKEREVNHYSKVLSVKEKMYTCARIYKRHGIKGVLKVFENEKIFYKAVLDGKIGYCLFKGIKTNKEI